jgi:hypothetical protein
MNNWIPKNLRNLPNKRLSKSVFWLLGILALFQLGCSSRPDGVMSRREMRSFLVDYYLLEGVLSAQRIMEEAEKDNYYHALFEKHGITKADFDSSLVYYTRNPKVFERIYNGVTNDLDEIKADVSSGKYFPVLPDSIRLKPEIKEIWSLDSIFYAIGDSSKSKLYFTVKNRDLLSKDVYYFSFRMRAFPHDSVQSGYTTFRVHYADGQMDSLRHKVLNDSIFRRYKYTLIAKRNFKIDSLSGVFYENLQEADSFCVYVDSVILKRKYVSALQDSIKLQLDTVPAKQDSIAGATDSVLTHQDSIRIQKDTLSPAKDSIKTTKEELKAKPDTIQPRRRGLQLRPAV